jgi:hypothetical protein
MREANDVSLCDLEARALSLRSQKSRRGEASLILGLNVSIQVELTDYARNKKNLEGLFAG